MVAPTPRAAGQSPKLGEIIRAAIPDLWGVPWLDDDDRNVLLRVAGCGTGTLGKMKFQCDKCEETEWRPLGCQDRHCPSCGVNKTEAWAQARVAELMLAPYFHLVFTVPGELYEIFQDNKTQLYGLFFSAVNETLAKFASDPRLLGGTPAYFSVLHTTNRRLGYHPHLHVVIAGAGWDRTKKRLVKVRNDDFLFPVRALAASFRGRFLTGLRALSKSGTLDWTRPSIHHLADGKELEALFTKLFAKNWQVRTDPVKGNTERVIRYLARYTYRTAISNARIIRHAEGEVTYLWRERKTGRKRYETLPRLKFVQRFARHIIPKSFRRVRFYGLLAPGNRKTALPLAQEAAEDLLSLDDLYKAVQSTLRPELKKPLQCVHCGAEGLRPVGVLRGPTYIHLSPETYPLPPGRSHLITEDLQ
jgi:hypothetical protein